MTAIEILGLEKTYSVGFWRKKPKHALRPLNLKVEEGEIFGFLGPNGAGKTTTLKLLMGLVFPTAGSARILGMEVNDPRMKAQIGFLPEQPYFYDYLTAHELLDYYGQLSGVAKRDRSRKVSEVLERVGLPDVGGMQLRKFSKGMLQRVGIAQAILHDPKVVFFDEPMSGLDPMGRREVREGAGLLLAARAFAAHRALPEEVPAASVHPRSLRRWCGAVPNRADRAYVGELGRREAGRPTGSRLPVATVRCPRAPRVGVHHLEEGGIGLAHRAGRRGGAALAPGAAVRDRRVRAPPAPDRGRRAQGRVLRPFRSPGEPP